MCELCRCLFPSKQGLKVSSQLIITLSTTAAALLVRGEYLRGGENPGGGTEVGRKKGGRGRKRKEEYDDGGLKREEGMSPHTCSADQTHADTLRGISLVPPSERNGHLVQTSDS